MLLTDQITQAITANTIDAENFLLTDQELAHLNYIEDQLFGYLNEHDITLERDGDDILRDYLIAYRIYPGITIPEFITLYTNLFN